MSKGKLVIRDKFEWFSDKDNINITKHGLSFAEIIGVFGDPYFFEIYDANHSDLNQHRYNCFGCANGKLQIVQVAYTDKNKRTHIISARPATSRERKLYYDRVRKIYNEM